MTQRSATATVSAHVSNAEIAAVMREIGDLLEIQGENPFRIRAYRNLARTLDTLSPSVQTMLSEGKDLDELPGVGQDLAGKMAEIVATGSCKQLEALRHTLPAGLHALMELPGLGPRRVAVLYRELGVSDLNALELAAKRGDLGRMRGFGGQTVPRLQAALAAHQTKSGRITLAGAQDIATPLLAWLRAADAAAAVEMAGSFRRCKETVGDLDLVAHAPEPALVIERLLRYSDTQDILSHGSTRASVRLRQGVQVDLRVVQQGSYGAALLYFTGSRSHNIALRRIAQARGWKLNEYGLFDGDRQVAGAREEEIFAALAMDWIPPELREDRGEIEAAGAHALPGLIRLADLRGDLHVHTSASDGQDSLHVMAEAARAQGLSYLAITDHSRGLRIGHGPDAAALVRQAKEIARLNAKLDGMILLQGAEVEILEDGSLDLPDAVLAKLDLVIVAVHSAFDLPREKQTERLLRAMANPYCTILAHPTGRLLLERPPYDVDMLRVLRHARARGCALEVNAQPNRLDLDDTWCRAAHDEGVTLCINSDAHSRYDFVHLAHGVNQARRGWIGPSEVLNCLGVQQLRERLRRMARQRVGEEKP